MKKIILAICVIAVFSFACDDIKKPKSPAGTLEVTYDFTSLGSGFTDDRDPLATGQVYVCLYSRFWLYPDNYMSIGETTQGSTTASDIVTADTIYPGTYYVVVFYDQKYSADTLMSAGDPYMIYKNGSTGNAVKSPYDVLNAAASFVDINKNGVTAIIMTYGDDPGLFGIDGAWDF